MRNFGYWRRGGKNAYCRISGATDRGREGGGLWRGEYRPLIPFLGKNNARKLRIQARACLMAAHDGRVDLLPEIRALETSDGEAVRVHAAWAGKYLEELLQK